MSLASSLAALGSSFAEVEEKKTLVPKDSVIDAEGQLQVMSALAELEASMAEASSAFSLTTEKDEAIEALEKEVGQEKQEAEEYATPFCDSTGMMRCAHFIGGDGATEWSRAAGACAAAAPSVRRRVSCHN